MSRAHRQEVLDDHMNDSNWKKMVGAGVYMLLLLISMLRVLTVLALIGKMDRADEGLATMSLLQNGNAKNVMHCPQEALDEKYTRQKHQMASNSILIYWAISLDSEKRIKGS
ncbi:hypothetical protein B0H10DRAFT_2025439 [Mycena sp. CBHHK59/15]|nr:hypothetical protein B0H10DRAFT_2025439 [Mycena sp. CBHHK59/15]